MQNEQWEVLVENLKGQFRNIEVFEEELDEGFEGSKGVHADVIIFTAPHGTFRIVRENRPLVIEKKMHYSHRPGDTARTEYKFSDSDFSHKLRVYKEDDSGEWREISLDQLGL